MDMSCFITVFLHWIRDSKTLSKFMCKIIIHIQISNVCHLTLDDVYYQKTWRMNSKILNRGVYSMTHWKLFTRNAIVIHTICQMWHNNLRTVEDLFCFRDTEGFSIQISIQIPIISKIYKRKSSEIWNNTSANCKPRCNGLFFHAESSKSSLQTEQSTAAMNGL